MLRVAAAAVLVLCCLRAEVAQITVGLTWLEVDAAGLQALGLGANQDPAPSLSMSAALSLLDRAHVRVLASAWVQTPAGFEATWHGEPIPGAPTIEFRVRPSLVAGDRIDLDGEYRIVAITPGPQPKGETTATVRGRPRALLRPGTAEVLTRAPGDQPGMTRVVLVTADVK